VADLEGAVLAHLRDSGETLRRAESQAPVIAAMAARLTAVFRAGGKLLVFGNGGSAADSQHFAAELMARFRRNRAPLPALALTVNTSDLTAISNDFGYDAVFERPVRALARPGDAVVAISTSGNSANVLKAAAAAQELGAAVLGFTGEEGGKLSTATARLHKELADVWLDVDRDPETRVAILRGAAYRHPLQLGLGSFMAYSVVLYYLAGHLSGYAGMN